MDQMRAPDKAAHGSSVELVSGKGQHEDLSMMTVPGTLGMDSHPLDTDLELFRHDV